MPYQTGVPCSSPHAWWNPQKPGCWNGTSWHHGFERWRKRTGRSDSSWANRSRAWLPSLPRVTMATSSGWHRQTPVQKTWRTQPRNGPITASVLARPPPRSVRLDDILGHVRCENRSLEHAAAPQSISITLVGKWERVCETIQAYHFTKTSSIGWNDKTIYSPKWKQKICVY